MIKFSPRYFVQPLLALVVIASLPAPAESGRAHARVGCGPAIGSIIDPTLRETFVRFDRTQSAAAAKVCALYHNNMETIVSD
jgi:hypothetical protein